MQENSETDYDNSWLDKHKLFYSGTDIQDYSKSTPPSKIEIPKNIILDAEKFLCDTNCCELPSNSVESKNNTIVTQDAIKRTNRIITAPQNNPSYLPNCNYCLSQKPNIQICSKKKK